MGGEERNGGKGRGEQRRGNEFGMRPWCMVEWNTGLERVCPELAGEVKDEKRDYAAGYKEGFVEGVMRCQHFAMRWFGGDEQEWEAAVRAAYEEE